MEQKKAAIVVHSGDHDKIYSAFIIGNGCQAMGIQTTLFFTFWGLNRLKKGQLENGPLSRMNFLGLGKWMIRKKMKEQNVASLKRLAMDFRELGGKILACDMTMDIMGVKKEDLDADLIDNYCAVGGFVGEARDSDINLFI